VPPSRRLRASRAAALGLALLVLAALALPLLVYPPEYVYRVAAWQESDALDWQKFPSHPLEPAPTAHRFAVAPDPAAPRLLGELAGTRDWDAFLAGQHTQACVVVHRGAVVYEGYFNGTRRDSIVTSFSVAKSVTSALVGIAVDEGRIGSVDDAVTRYLPELAVRDPRFDRITIRHLLLMASGLDYQASGRFLLDGDDPLTTYYPDQRAIALKNTRVAEPPGLHRVYNKYHPQLLGLVLERTTGMGVTAYLQAKLWDPLGMEYGGSWSTDSRTSDFEKMETGVNARAIDFARFGALFLNGGEWGGRQVISRAWVEESTRPWFPPDDAAYYPPFFAAMPGRAYYGFMWWGFARPDGTYDFAAEGDKGQFLYVSPRRGLVIARFGFEYGLSARDWFDLFYRFADQYPG
jgi:CubicO group peptidase (beta-lactamase class C family)